MNPLVSLGFSHYQDSLHTGSKFYHYKIWLWSYIFAIVQAQLQSFYIATFVTNNGSTVFIMSWAHTADREVRVWRGLTASISLGGDIICCEEKDGEEEMARDSHNAIVELKQTRNMASYSKYLTAKNSSIAGGILLVLYLLKRRRRTPKQAG